MPKPTIADVARVAGVTKATVSHALSGRRPVSEQTRTRVVNAARALNWTPSRSARALATNRANAIGIVLARDPRVIASDTFFPAFIAGVEAVLTEEEFALVLQVVETREAEERAYRAIAAGRADGVIMLDLRCEDWRVPFVAELSLKAVLLGTPNNPGTFSSVRTDDRSPVRKLIAHLRELGHSRIAHVAGPLDYVHAHARAEAYTAEVGSDELLREGDFGAASGRDWTAELLNLQHPPTAILYANDTMAISGLSYARSIGLDVPGDLAITGFDDDHLSAHLSPALTTVSTSPFERGEVSTRLLLEVLDGAERRDVELDCNRLSLRSSTLGAS